MSFHQRLQHERVAKGWSIEQLSAASGVTIQRLRLLERNLVEVVSDNLKACLAQALGVDFNAPPSTITQTMVTAEHAPVPRSPVLLEEATPQPLALHLPTDLREQLEHAAQAQGRTLHGEVLARLAASIHTNAPTTNNGPPQANAHTSSIARISEALMQWTEADWNYITRQVARRWPTASSTR